MELLYVLFKITAHCCDLAHLNCLIWVDVTEGEVIWASICCLFLKIIDVNLIAVLRMYIAK